MRVNREQQGMAPNIGWSRSRRWLLETCARRYVLTYPGDTASRSARSPTHACD